MKFILMWLIASFVVFYTRFSAVTVLDVKFFLEVLFTGLLWVIGLTIVFFILMCIIAAIGVIMENRWERGNMKEFFGVITKDLFRLQRICNLERSLLLLILDFKAKRKELKEKIEKLRKEVKNVRNKKRIWEHKKRIN